MNTIEQVISAFQVTFAYRKYSISRQYTNNVDTRDVIFHVRQSKTQKLYKSTSQGEKMQHSHETQNTNSHSRVIHLILLIIGIIAVPSLYIYFQNTTSVMFGIVALVLAHIIAVILITQIGRGLLRKLAQHFHGTPTETHAHDSHSHDNLETEGHTISWVFFYNILVKLIFLGKEQQFREGVVAMASIQSQEKVLEVGCGTGSFAIIAKQNTDSSVQIVATDAAPEMIEKARQEAEKAGVNIDFQTGLAERIEFPDNTFDVVMNSFMVHHLPDNLKAKAFAEMYRVLKPGGRIQVVDFEPPKRGFYKMYIRMLVGAMMQIDNSEILPLLEEAGFNSIKMTQAGHSLATAIVGTKAD